ncbi:MAG: primosomal protein N' [Bacteroidia bacterium]
MEEALATFVNVILPVNLNKLYTYRIPAEYERSIQTGIRVAVQFGSSKVYAAIVAQIHHNPPKDYEAKYILSVIDNEPVVNQHQLTFWQWMSNYYMCSIGDVMSAALPSALKLQSKTVITLVPEVDYKSMVLDDKEYLIAEALEIKTQLTIDEVIQILQIKTVMPVIKSMYAKGIILLHEQIDEKYTPKFITCIKLYDDYQNDAAKEQLIKQLEKSEKQLNVLLAYINLSFSHKHISRAMLLKTPGVNAASVNTLLKKNIFDLYELHVDRIAIDEMPETEFELNPEQHEAYQKVKAFFAEKKTVLIHGVTGSGKTHIYVNLIKEALTQNKQVLYLLPEIALTSQIVNRIEKYFGHTCISFHSKYSNNERVEIWQKVMDKKINLIIGARSALFLPFSNLGLIVVDEEHETAYKQQDPAPRFHARDTAIYLAHQHGADCILGSATPSVESYFNAMQNRYGLVKLDYRHGNVKLPKITTVDIAEEVRLKKMVGGHFTSVLYNAIKQSLSENGQIILFQNRRGYAPILECKTCRWILKCANCDIGLSYHKGIESMKCHYCGYLQKIPSTCLACGGNDLSFKGFGTEKIEDELKVLFPEARISRLDLDAAKTKHGHEQIISEFEQHRADILVGTQMLSKGLDFEKVNLAGIINADQLFSFPDFRASERAFQLIEQVAGRTGRRDKQGLVIVQATQTGHHVINCAASHDFEQLYNKEIYEREKFLYPPFTRLIKLYVKHKDFKTAKNGAYLLANAIKRELQSLTVLGPEAPHVSKIRNLYIQQLLIKIKRNNKNLAQTKQVIFGCINNILALKEFKNCLIFADVDPL